MSPSLSTLLQLYHQRIIRHGTMSPMFLIEFPISITIKEFHMHKHSSSVKPVTSETPPTWKLELHSISCERSGIRLASLRISIHAEIQRPKVSD